MNFIQNLLLLLCLSYFLTLLYNYMVFATSSVIFLSPARVVHFGCFLKKFCTALKSSVLVLNKCSKVKNFVHSSYIYLCMIMKCKQ